MARETALFILGGFSSFVDPRGTASVISEQVITLELCQFKKPLHHYIIGLFKRKVGHHSLERGYSIITVVWTWKKQQLMAVS